MDVLVLAWQEARSQNEIGPQHILLGLLREGQGVAAHVMREAGITEERVRAEIGTAIGGWPEPSGCRFRR